MGTHTYVELEVPEDVYDYIKYALLQAEYTHAIMESGSLDMHGIALTKMQSDSKPKYDLDAMNKEIDDV